MTEPTNEPLQDDQAEPIGPSAAIDDVEVFEAPDQWPTADLSDIEGES